MDKTILDTILWTIETKLLERLSNQISGPELTVCINNAYFNFSSKCDVHPIAEIR